MFPFNPPPILNPIPRSPSQSDANESSMVKRYKASSSAPKAFVSAPSEALPSPLRWLLLVMQVLPASPYLSLWNHLLERLPYTGVKTCQNKSPRGKASCYSHDRCYADSSSCSDPGTTKVWKEGIPSHFVCGFRTGTSCTLSGAFLKCLSREKSITRFTKSITRKSKTSLSFRQRPQILRYFWNRNKRWRSKHKISRGW